MKKSLGILFSSLTAAAFLSGCNGSNNGGTTPGTGTNCGGPPQALQVLYPKPNNTNVPSNVASQGIFIATKTPLPAGNNYDFFIVQSDGQQTFTGNFVAVNASSVPSPHGTPRFTNPSYYGTSFPSSYVVGPLQTVNVYWNNGGSGCTPNVIVSTFATR